MLRGDITVAIRNALNTAMLDELHRRFDQWTKARLWRRLHHAVLD